MPSYLRNPYRSYSFPPCLEDLEYENSQTKDLPDIDDDPFAHFISPITEEDDPWELSLSAGIVLPEGHRSSKTLKFKSGLADKWARYVKHNHNQLHSQYHDSAIYEDDEESFMGLDDARLNDSPSVVTQIAPCSFAILEPTRGRAQELMARKVQNRGRQSRTFSGHRHSWRAPSPDLFTVDESEEEETVVMRRPKTRKANTDRRRSSTRSRSRVRFEVVERARL